MKTVLRPSVGRVFVTVNDHGFDTSVWAEPAPGSQKWTDGAGGPTKPDWRIRFTPGVGRRTEVTLI
ncbi:MAG: hypothetical protein AAF658_07135 [Myxococcota bacterium]